MALTEWLGGGLGRWAGGGHLKLLLTPFFSSLYLAFIKCQPCANHFEKLTSKEVESLSRAMTIEDHKSDSIPTNKRATGPDGFMAVLLNLKGATLFKLTQTFENNRNSMSFLENLCYVKT